MWLGLSSELNKWYVIYTAPWNKVSEVEGLAVIIDILCLDISCVFCVVGSCLQNHMIPSRLILIAIFHLSCLALGLASHPPPPTHTHTSPTKHACACSTWDLSFSSHLKEHTDHTSLRLRVGVRVGVCGGWDRSRNWWGERRLVPQSGKVRSESERR